MAGLPVEINPLFLSSSGGYTVGRSLRFRSSATAYLNRTFGTPTSATTWTVSFWVKRGLLSSSARYSIMGNNNTGTNSFNFEFASDTIDISTWTTSYAWRLVTTQVFRDPSAWYHVVLAYDSGQATSTNRVKLYINGSQVTAFSTASYPSLSFDPLLNVNGKSTAIGSAGTTTQPFDGYLAEVNFIDGQALTPSSFGAYDTNGVWQPIKYTGTYGTNGFYLPFSNTTSTTTLVQDSSGNGNNWTPNNISLTAGTTYDSMIDSPTVSASSSNYAVLNPLIPPNSGYTNTFADGNQNGTITGTGGSAIFSSITMSTGSWYWETYVVNVGGGTNIDIGICSTAYPPSTMSNANGAIGGVAGGYSIFNLSGASYKANNNVATAYGVTYTNGDTIMTAFDATNGKIWFGKNGTWMASGDPATAANPTFSGIPSASYWAGFGNAGGVSRTVQAIMNFGQRPFSYTPPSGYSALNTYNLPTPTIKNGALYNAATLYTGTGSSQAIANSQSNGGNNALGKTFYPDLTWIKSRSAATDHKWTDSVRGVTKALISNTTGAETTDANGLTAFSSTGFTVGTDTIYNNNTATYVAWQWNAGSGSSSSNTSGSITSTVSVNTTAGFSVVTYTGTGANATVGHGLGVAPSMIIFKSRISGAANWIVYHSSLGATQGLFLNQTAAASTSATYFNNTSPTSSVMSIGTASLNNSGESTVAYCFAAVRGYSAFGSYTGNGSTDGIFVYTGFRPRWIMIKNATNTPFRWVIYDTSRNTYNLTTNSLAPNDSNAEVTNSSLDILSNGFKWREGGGTVNNSGDTYIYAAFAENPFNYSRAR